MDILDMLDRPDRRTGASPGARKTTVLSYLHVIQVEWFITRRTQRGFIDTKVGNESMLL